MGQKRHWPEADHQTACAIRTSKINIGLHEKCCTACHSTRHSRFATA